LNNIPDLLYIYDSHNQEMTHTQKTYPTNMSESSISSYLNMAQFLIDEKGYKHIPFNDYEIEDEHMQSIIQDVIKEYKIKPAYRQQAFKFTILLGASPKTKLKVE
jgi:hypothetical protein